MQSAVSALANNNGHNWRRSFGVFGEKVDKNDVATESLVEHEKDWYGSKSFQDLSKILKGTALDNVCFLCD